MARLNIAAASVEKFGGRNAGNCVRIPRAFNASTIGIAPTATPALTATPSLPPSGRAQATPIKPPQPQPCTSCRCLGEDDAASIRIPPAHILAAGNITER